MILGDLPSLKAMLEIPDCVTSEDRRLLFLLRMASEWIEELCNREFQYKQWTEYLDARGSQRLLLSHRPAYPNEMTIYFEGGSNYGAGNDPFPSTSLLTYGTDYVLEIDDVANNRSKRGIVYRINAVWPRKWARVGRYLSPFEVTNPGVIKATYWAGFTIDQLPGPIRLALITLIGKMRNYFPLAMEIGGEGYEDRSLSYTNQARNYLLETCKDLLVNARNHKW